MQWLYQARKRYGLVILNYMVTSNHIHLLVVDTGKRDVISKGPRGQVFILDRFGLNVKNEDLTPQISQIRNIQFYIYSKRLSLFYRINF